MQIDWWTLGLQVVNFLILVWLLHRFLINPVRRVIQARKQETEHAFDKAREKEHAGEAARQDYERKQSELEEERQELLRRAHEQLTAEREKVLSAAQDRADQLIAEARKTIESERQAALADLREEIAELAGDLAKSLLRDSGAQPDDDTVLAQLEAEIDKLSADERGRLKADAKREAGGVTVVTAEALDPDQRARWAQRLGDALAGSDAIDFDADPDLIAGAELRFPHTVLRCSWADRLARARAAMLDVDSQDAHESQSDGVQAEATDGDDTQR